MDENRSSTPKPRVVDEEVLSIEVSARVLRHLSRGIYRTPAGALKELVSNSYDARAQKVVINTGFPLFEKIIVTDNGDGMVREQFKRVVQNIGLSEKVAGEPLALDGGQGRRHVIGHYGIGLLAVGQLASRLHLVSKTRGEDHGLEADIDFDQFEVSQMGPLPRAVAKNERELERGEPAEDAKFPIGKCSIRTLRFKDEDRNRHFTRLELSPVRAEVYKKLSGHYRSVNLTAQRRQRYFKDFAELLKLFRERESSVKQGQYPYEKLCWELAVYCPLRYPEIGEFERKLQRVADLAATYDFSVKIDGLELYKPFEESFFGEKESPVEHVFLWRNEPYTRDQRGPRVTAYVIYKRRIRPKALQGVLIREAGVAVGMYDTTYLEYPFNEGMKFNQLSGELFAEGLSGALNIDRNSFNETDETYLALAEWFHRKLNQEVFPKIKNLQQRPEASRRGQNLEFVRSLLQRYAEATGRRRLQVKFAALGRRKGLFEASGRSLTINQDHPDGRGSTAKLEKLLLGGFLILAGEVDVDTVNGTIQEIAKLKRAIE